MIRNKWLWLWLVVGITLITLVPLAMDWLIIGNGFPSNIDNSDWVGFFGGYIGSIIGAIVSLAGIVITIRHTSKENRRDRELEIRPYCLVKPIEEKNFNPHFERHSMSFRYDPNNEVSFANDDEIVSHSSYFEIANIGVGPAINCKICQDEYCTYLPNRKVNNEYSNQVSCSCIAPNESLYIQFDVWYDDNLIERNCKGKIDSEQIFTLSVEHYTQCDIPFSINYSDLIGTSYTQFFHISLSFGSAFDENIKPTCRMRCSVSIRNDIEPISTEK